MLNAHLLIVRENSNHIIHAIHNWRLQALPQQGDYINIQLQPNLDVTAKVQYTIHFYNPSQPNYYGIIATPLSNKIEVGDFMTILN